MLNTQAFDFQCPRSPPTFTTSWASSGMSCTQACSPQRNPGPLLGRPSVSRQLWQGGHQKQPGIRRVHVVSQERKSLPLYQERLFKPRMGKLWPAGPPPVSVKFYQNPVTPTCLRTVCGYFHATEAKLSSRYRDHSPKRSLSDPLQGKFADPWSRWCISHPKVSW